MIFVILMPNRVLVQFMFPYKIPENRRKSQKTLDQENFFSAMSWISFQIHQSHLKFDGDHEYVSYFDNSSTVEEISVYFRCTAGKFEFSNFQKVKSELCFPHSFYQFKHSLSKEEVVYLIFICV